MQNTKRPPLEKQTITVTKSTLWGPVANDELYGFNEPLTPNDFVPGETIDVLVKRSKPTEKYPNGKLYIAQILGKASSPVTAASPAASPVAPVAEKVAEKAADAPAPKQAFKPRDFDKEARGKTRCAQFEAALQSPGLATLPYKSIEEFIDIVRQAADAGVEYTFEEK